MDIYKIKWTRLQSEILRLLCIKAGQTPNIRTIATLLNVSPTAVSNALIELEKTKIIHIKRSKTINLVSVELDRNNPLAIQLKRTENLKLIYESALADYLYNEFPGCTIILFGSYARGEDAWIGDTEDTRSDIDIAIIGTKGKKIDLVKFDKLFEKKISINFYTSWNDIHKHLRNNILNGIVLSGSVDL